MQIPSRGFIAERLLTRETEHKEERTQLTRPVWGEVPLNAHLTSHQMFSPAKPLSGQIAEGSTPSASAIR
jgi:hypothetical protein